MSNKTKSLFRAMIHVLTLDSPYRVVVQGGGGSVGAPPPPLRFFADSEKRRRVAPPVFVLPYGANLA